MNRPNLRIDISIEAELDLDGSVTIRNGVRAGRGDLGEVSGRSQSIGEATAVVDVDEAMSTIAHVVRESLALASREIEEALDRMVESAGE